MNKLFDHEYPWLSMDIHNSIIDVNIFHYDIHNLDMGIHYWTVDIHVLIYIYN